MFESPADINLEIRIMTSKTLRLIIGPERTAFFVHEAALKDLSDVFRFLLEAPFQDSSSDDRVVEIPDISKDSFTRLCEFAYTGNYSHPKPIMRRGPMKRETNGEPGGAEGSPIKRLRTVSEAADPNQVGSAKNVADNAASATGPSNMEAEPSQTETATANPKPASETKKTRPLYSLYSACRAYDKHSRSVKSGSPSSGAAATPKKNIISDNRYAAFQKFLTWRLHWFPPFAAREEPVPGRENGPGESWLPIFLGHAEMYRIGDKYDIRALRDVSRAKLHRSLKFWLIYPDDESMADLTELLRYVYNNTVERDKLREMIYYYTSCLMDDVAHLETFARFLQCAPEFTRRMVEILIQQSKSVQRGG